MARAHTFLPVAGVLLFLTTSAFGAKPEDGNESLNEPVILEIVSKFGRALYRECSHTIVLSDANPDQAHLRCLVADGLASADRWIVQASELSKQESQSLRDTLEKFDLFLVRHTGKDMRSTDGSLQTITLIRIRNGNAVSVVTTGNPTFSEPGPGLQLLTQLGEIRDRQIRQSHKPHGNNE